MRVIETIPFGLVIGDNTCRASDTGSGLVDGHVHGVMQFVSFSLDHESVRDSARQTVLPWFPC